MPAPPQSTHKYLKRLCSQMLELSQARHRLLWRPCSHTEPLPQHKLLGRPCSQKEPPQQLLHVLLMRPCSQIPALLHSRHTFFRQLSGHFLWIWGILKALVLFACQRDTLVPSPSCFLAQLHFKSTHEAGRATACVPKCPIQRARLSGSCRCSC